MIKRDDKMIMMGDHKLIVHLTKYWYKENDKKVMTKYDNDGRS